MFRISLFLLLIVPFFLPIQSFVSYVRLKSPSGEEVLVLGDRHNCKAIDSINEQHVCSFVAFFNRQNSNPRIPCYLEFNEQALQPDYTNASTFTTLFAQRAKIESSLAYHFCEPRGIESDHLAGAFMSMEIQFAEPMQRLIMAQKHAENQRITMTLPPNVWTKIDKKLRALPGSQITAEDFLNGLERNRQILAQVIDKYSSDEKITALLRPMYESYREGQQKILKAFVGKNAMEFNRAFFHLFHDCKTMNALLQLFVEYQICFLTQTDQIFADILFFDKIVTAIQEGHKKVILIVGNAHLTALKKMCIQLGYQELDSAQTFVKVDQVNYSCNLEQLEALGGTLQTAYQKFIGVDWSDNSNVCDNVQDKAAQCAYCSKKDNLLTCSRCKAVQYCGSACQKAHWSTHKARCKANK